MDDRDRLEANAGPREFEHDPPTGAIAERGDAVGVDAGLREKDGEAARPTACIRPTSPSRGMVRASMASGLPKNT